MHIDAPVRQDAAQNTTVSVYRQADPWLVWDQMLEQPRDVDTVLAYIAMHRRAFLVVGAHVDEKKEAVVALEYVELSLNKNGSLGYMEYGTSAH